MEKVRSVPGPTMWAVVGPVHHFYQRIHGFAHLFVIQGTHIEVEIFKGFLGTSGKLCHGRVRIAQNHPFGLVYPVIKGRAC